MNSSNFFSYRPSPLFAMPLWIHICFMILSAVCLILGYRMKKQLHKLIMLTGILSTSLIYFVRPGISFYILAFEEIILFIWTVVLMIMEEHQEEKKTAETAEKEQTAKETDITERK